MGGIRRRSVGAAVSVIGVAAASVVMVPAVVDAVDTDMTIDNTSMTSAR